MITLNLTRKYVYIPTTVPGLDDREALRRLYAVLTGEIPADEPEGSVTDMADQLDDAGFGSAGPM